MHPGDQGRFIVGGWNTNSPMFRDLSTQEVIDFVKYANENEPLQGSRWELAHPVCRMTWMNKFNLDEDGNPR